MVVDVKAAGLCHTDVGIMYDQQWTERVGPFPLTPGPEVAGIVAELGEGVTDWGGRRLRRPLPAGTTRPGLGRDGDYSAKCVAHPADLVAVPDSVSFELATTGTDAATAHPVDPGRSVAARDSQ